MVCKHCGGPVQSNQSNCEYCGAQIDRPQPQVSQNVVINNYNTTYNTNNNNYNDTNRDFVYERTVSNKNKIVALLICVIFGLFGIHRFYVGKIGTGIVYFLTGGLCGIGWIIDIISIATGRFKDKYGLYLK